MGMSTNSKKIYWDIYKPKLVQQIDLQRKYLESNRILEFIHTQDIQIYTEKDCYIRRKLYDENSHARNYFPLLACFKIDYEYILNI